MPAAGNGDNAVQKITPFLRFHHQAEEALPTVTKIDIGQLIRAGERP